MDKRIIIFFALILLVAGVKFMVDSSVKSQAEANDKKIYLQAVERNNEGNPAMVCAYKKLIDKYGVKEILKFDQQADKGELPEDSPLVWDSIRYHEECSGEQI